MGFLHKLWDETLAGPTPETGLGKLRKYNSFSGGSGPAVVVRPATAKDIPISRSITIIRTATDFNAATSNSAPVSPSTPHSPLTPEAPGGDFKKFTRRKSSTVESAENRSRALYDWVIMSAWDRC